MRKLIFTLAILVISLAGYSQISVSKVGDFVKITGLTRVNAPMLGDSGGTLYLSVTDKISVQGSTISLGNSELGNLVTFSFNKVTTKFLQSSANNWVQYLIDNGYFVTGSGGAETDPVYGASIAATISAIDTAHYYQAYQHRNTVNAVSGIVKGNGAGVYSAVTDNSANWNNAYGWGNHAGLYPTNAQHGAKLDTTLATTTLRGNWSSAYGWGNHAGLYPTNAQHGTKIDTTHLSYDITAVDTTWWGRAEVDPVYANDSIYIVFFADTTSVIATKSDIAGVSILPLEVDGVKAWIGDTTLLWDWDEISQGLIGINDTLGRNGLTLWQSADTILSDYYGIRNKAEIGSAEEVYGLYQEISINDTVGDFRGIRNKAEIGSAEEVYGLYQDISINDTVGLFYGFYNRVFINDGNLVYGYYNKVDGGSTTVDNQYGFYQSTPKNRVKYNYGIYLENQAVGDSASYAIYSAGGDVRIVGRINGGVDNAVTADYGAILAGSQDTVSGEYGVIVGGQYNTASEGLSTVVNGLGNTASGIASTVVNGDGNTASEELSTVVNGMGNTASGMLSTVINGYDNTASGTESTIVNGGNGLADKFGQVVTNATKVIDAIGGEAQSSIFQLADTVHHLEDAWHDLYLDGENGSDALLTIAENSAWTFVCTVVGLDDQSTKRWSYKIEGLITNLGGTTTLDASTVTTIFESDADFACQAVGDNTNDALLIQVKDATYGEDVVRWVATVRTTEVMWPAEFKD